MSRDHIPVRWPTEAIWQAVSPLLPGFSVEVLPSIDSTSSELMRRARAGRVEPTLLVTEEQTAGRGRLGRDWHSEAIYRDTGVVPALTFSLGLPLAPREWSGLSLAVGVAVAESLQPRLPAAGSGQPRILLKWPNDLWLQDERKLGGILVETASLAGAAGEQRYVVVGIGLNVLPVLAKGLRTAPACLREVDGALTAATALERIAAPLVQALLGFADAGFAPFQARFAQRDLLAGRSVVLSDGSQGTAHGVTEDGTLLVHTAGGMQAVNSSEVSVRPVED
jgi:BirA family biotin operon repressor/biotin-[acetyl-CoA-carboxylase] ligase